MPPAYGGTAALPSGPVLDIAPKGFCGGLRVVDFANPWAPEEVGYFISAPVKGTPTVQSNAVFVDNKGRIFPIDRLRSPRKADGVDGSRSRHLSAKFVVAINHEQKEPSTQDITVWAGFGTPSKPFWTDITTGPVDGGGSNLSVDIPNHWRPDASFLGKRNREQLVSIAKESGYADGNGSLGSYKKSELVASLAKHFQNAKGANNPTPAQVKAREWLPEAMLFPAIDPHASTDAEIDREDHDRHTDDA